MIDNSTLFDIIERELGGPTPWPVAANEQPVTQSIMKSSGEFV